MSDLQRALEIAVDSHKSQRQKDGTPYALHPIRLSMSLQSEEQKIVALLHDVVEDTDWTFEDLIEEGFNDHVIEALRLLTHTDGSPYEDYIERLASNPLARAVKKADLADNMDLKRIPEPSEKDFARLQKYHGAWRRLNVE